MYLCSSCIWAAQIQITTALQLREANSLFPFSDLQLDRSIIPWKRTEENGFGDSYLEPPKITPAHQLAVIFCMVADTQISTWENRQSLPFQHLVFYIDSSGMEVKHSKADMWMHLTCHIPHVLFWHELSTQSDQFGSHSKSSNMMRKGYVISNSYRGQDLVRQHPFS